VLTYELDIESRDGSDGWSLDWIMMREEITSIRQNGDDGRSSQGTILTRFYSSDKGTMIHDDIEDSQVNNILLTTSNCGPADKGAAAAGFLTKWKAGELENLEPYAGHNAEQVPTPFPLHHRGVRSIWTRALTRATNALPHQVRHD